jgi:hypothetical protein
LPTEAHFLSCLLFVVAPGEGVPKRFMATELTHDEVEKWAARVRREALRNPCFDHKTSYTWAAVGGLAHAVWKAGYSESDREVLVDLATDVLMIEVKARNLPIRPRKKYHSAVWLCFHNYGAFWEKRPLLHIVGELSWIIDAAQANSKDTADYLESKIDCSAMWGMPFIGHYG